MRSKFLTGANTSDSSSTKTGVDWNALNVLHQTRVQCVAGGTFLDRNEPVL